MEKLRTSKDSGATVTNDGNNAMLTIELDAAPWTSVVAFYKALLAALGMPERYSCNINAVLEAMVWDYAFPETRAWHDKIKAINEPYNVLLRNTMRLPREILEEITYFRQALLKARAEFRARQGKDVDVSLEIIS